MSILEAVSKGADLKHFNEKKEPKNNFDAKKADKDLKACPVCKTVWEVMVFNQTLDYKYYQNFPRYGKKKGVCPSCGSELIAKCGEIVIHHWAHKKKCSDHWWENETEWHRNWKDKFPKEWQEVVHFSDDGEKHIADVKTRNGFVIEFQHAVSNVSAFGTDLTI